MKKGYFIKVQLCHFRFPPNESIYQKEKANGSYECVLQNYPTATPEEILMALYDTNSCNQVQVSEAVIIFRGCFHAYL